MLSKYKMFWLALVLMLMGSFLQAEETRHYIIIIEEAKDTLPPSIEGPGNISGGTEDKLELSATIRDNIGVAYSRLYLLNIGEDRYIEKDMEGKGGDVYATTIILPQKIGEINYYLIAKDLEGNEIRDPETGTYRITVIDNKPPIIEAKTGDIYQTGTGEDQTIEAMISDNVKLVSVTLHYTPIDGEEAQIPFTIDEKTAKAYLKIPKDKVGIVTYYITAKDKAGNIARNPEGTQVYKISVIDNIKPVVSLSPDNPKDVESGDIITILGDFSDNIGVTEASLIWKPINAIEVSSGLVDFMDKKARLKIRDDFIGTFKYLLEVEDKTGNKATTNPLEVKVSERLPRGSLFVTSSPKYAKVFLEGRYRGKTPLEISGLRPWKSFELMLKLKDFEVWKTKTFVEPEKTTNINVTLNAEGEGTLFIVSSPEMAKVYINREFVGTTPLRDIIIEAGRYNLMVVKDGYRPCTKEIFVLNGQKVYLSFNLESGVYSEVIIKRRRVLY